MALLTHDGEYPCAFILKLLEWERYGSVEQEMKEKNQASLEVILHSLHKPHCDIEQSWIAESEARYEAYKRGELNAMDWEEIKKRYER
jgi:hypothetical protein